MPKPIVRFKHGFIFWPANRRPYAQIALSQVDQNINVRNVTRFDLDDQGFPMRLENSMAIYVRVKE